MNTEQPFSGQSLAQKLENPSASRTLNPAELDALLQLFYTTSRQTETVQQLAEHYKVSVKYIRDLLVARQVSYVRLMTDFAQPGTEQRLQEILRNQNANVAEAVQKANVELSQRDECLRQSKFLLGELARVLALYQTKIADANPAKTTQS